jgi:signal peptide peptidase SppA
MERNSMRQFNACVAALFKSPLHHVEAEQVRAASTARSAPQQHKSIAVIPIHGALETRPTMMGYWLGMPSYEAIGVTLDVAIADESVSMIVLDIASPGGMVYGAQELADKIFRARAIKPIVAVANPMAASGAYWLACASTRVVVTPSGDVGSVGVIGEHDDDSQALEMAGLKVTYILSEGSPYKGEMAVPLTTEARANMQSRADAIYAQFVGDISRFRGIGVDQVVDKFGKGRVVSAKQAISAGMVDSIGTLQATVVNLLSGRIKLGTERAQDLWDAPTPREVRMERAASIARLVE